MSHDPHGATTGQTSTGTITMGVKVALVMGVMLAVVQGLFVGMSSGYGRVWPAADSTKIQLPPSNLTS